MKHLYEKNKVRHFLVWLAAYLILSVVAINIGAGLGLSDHVSAAVPLLILSVVMLAYLRRTRIGTDVGLGVPAAVSPARMWFYLPLVALVALPLIGHSRGSSRKCILGARVPLILEVRLRTLPEIGRRGQHVAPGFCSVADVGQQQPASHRDGTKAEEC